MQKIMLKKVVLFLFGLAVVMGMNYFFTRDTSKKIVWDETKEAMIVGTNSGYPPFVVVDKSGELVGFDIDLVHSIAQGLGKELIIKDMGMDALLVALKQNKIDIIIGGLSITKKRLHEIEMIPYYSDKEFAFALVFYEEVPKGVAHINDLIQKYPGAVICTQVGTVFEEYLQELEGNFLIKTLDEVIELVMDLQYGRSIAALMERSAAYDLQRLHPQLRVVSFPLSDKDQLSSTGIGIAKGNEILISKIKEIIAEFEQRGFLKQLEEKWFVGK